MKNVSEFELQFINLDISRMRHVKQHSIKERKKERKRLTVVLIQPQTTAVRSYSRVPGFKLRYTYAVG